MVDMKRNNDSKLKKYAIILIIAGFIIFGLYAILGGV